MAKLIAGEQVDFEETSYSYDELLNTSFKVVLNTDYYQKSRSVWLNMENDDNYMRNLLKDALSVKIVGIVKIDSDSVLSGYSSYGNIGYTKDLTEYVINKINESEIAKEQLANAEINVFNGMPFSTSEFNMNDLTYEQKMQLAMMSSDELASLISSYSNSSYEGNLLTLGIVDLDSPSIINIYPKDFDSKDTIKKLIDEYNEKKQDAGKDDEVISYTDYVGLLMSSVTTIVDVISYVLIAFVSVSLIVSSIMIGIITYISVLERTKEIGILRSIGASKKDISRVFNAETFIVGSLAGVIGILTTLLLNIPINIIIKKLSGINHIASLPVIGAIILVIISVLLTMLAGLIPSKMASKKDPVEALRSE